MRVGRRLVPVLMVSLVAIAFAAVHLGHPGVTSTCTLPATPLRIGNTVACIHSDQAPPGIDVTAPVASAVLADRVGVGPAVIGAAADAGVPTPITAQSTATSPAVPCDGDGRSGYRIQAMYVVEAGQPNRYSSLLDSFQIWAAGTDDVVNRSAALTGGVRHLRYVTDPGTGGSCLAQVLNVTVPVGSTASFGATVAAVQALGYNDPARKYLMWTDANVLCGVASMYSGDNPDQQNINNGFYPQYARVDSGCWGLGNGSGEHSVEAHELMHTLGGVQASAPHSTKVGHCWDESDTMCYADGGAFGMQQICPVQDEYLYDCNHDDYFSTEAPAGSYLGTHWNTADSRFLIGGGNGTAGGSVAAPSLLGATISVNNPAIPGLATQASVAPALPTGRTLRSVSWSAARSDCAFEAPTSLSSSVTCGASATADTTVTATVTDSTGAVKSVTSALTFVTGTARPVSIILSAAGQTTASASTASVCTGAPFGLVATAVDAASGSPVKGLGVALSAQVGGVLGTLGSIATSLLGSSSLTQTITAATTYTAGSPAGAVYAAGTSPTLTAVPGTCEESLTGSLDRTSTYFGDPVTVTGTVTRPVGGSVLPVPGLAVPVRLTTLIAGVTTVTPLGSANTAADGSYRAVVHPVASGVVSLEVPATAGYAARSVAVGAVQVALPVTRLSAAVNRNDVGYGSTIVVSGRLERVAGTAVTPAQGSVSIVVTPVGGTAVRIGAATVSGTGTWSAAIALKVTGSLSVSFAGAAGQPAAATTIGPVTAGRWTTRVSASSTRIGTGARATVTGTLTKTYGGVTLPARGLRILIRYGTTRIGTATTSATGTFRVRITRAGTGRLNVVVPAVPGYAASWSAPFRIRARPAP
jgi:hypothetical protein